MTNVNPPVFQKTDLAEQNRRSSTATAEFPVEETHGIALWSANRLLTDSRGLGWHDAYTSLATEAPWHQTLRAVPHYCIAYCLHRPADVTRSIDGERGQDSVELRPRHFGAVPADRPSTWRLTGNPDIQLVYLRRSVVDRLAEEELGVDRKHVELVPELGFADGMLEQLVLALLEATHHDAVNPTNGLYADHVIRMIALQLLRHHSNQPNHTSTRTANVGASWARMHHVRDLIESALGEDLGLERLAAEAGIGAHAFAAAFTRAFGMPPYRYVIERRIERVKNLLRGSDTPVATIAYETGFASQSHLATAFKRAVGVTPGEYRKDGSSRR